MLFIACFLNWLKLSNRDLRLFCHYYWKWGTSYFVRLTLLLMGKLRLLLVGVSLVVCALIHASYAFWSIFSSFMLAHAQAMKEYIYHGGEISTEVVVDWNLWQKLWIIDGSELVSSECGSMVKLLTFVCTDPVSGPYWPLFFNLSFSFLFFKLNCLYKCLFLTI